MGRGTEVLGGPRAKAAAAAVLVASLCSAASAAGWGGGSAPDPVHGRGAQAPGAPVAPNPCRRRRPRLRCPDMIMSAPGELEFDRSTIPGRVLLRATSSINNRGLGPLEVSAHRVGRHRWRTYQAIYDRRGRRHVFHTRASLVFKHVSGQRYGVGFVGDAGYCKLSHLASFQLRSLGPHRRPLPPLPPPPTAP